MQELKQFAGWSENSMRMAVSIEELGAAKAWPLIEGLEEGAICPCCNTSTCASLAMGRNMAMLVHEDHAEKLRETAAMLKQAFQTVLCCAAVPAAYMCCLQKHPPAWRMYPCMSPHMSSMSMYVVSVSPCTLAVGVR